MRLKVPQTAASTVRELARVLRDPALAVWALFVLMTPFYVFKSGLPQPGDILLLPLLPLSLAGWRGRLAPQLARPTQALVRFTIWVVLVDWGWAVILGNFGLFGADTFLLFPVYYVYNTLVFLIVCVMTQRYGARFIWLTLSVVLASVLLQVIATFVVHRGVHGVRGVGFFNSPNQLGFFALVSASIIAIGGRQLGFGAIRTGTGLTLCLYLSLVSASRAAVFGIGILLVLTVISNPARIAVASLLLLALIAVGGPVSDAIEGTQQRMNDDRYPDRTFFQERGYDRIIAHKEYWLLGAGEGGTRRFAETTVSGAIEIHSSIGTIFFCYGIVGMGLFLAFLLRIVERSTIRSMLFLAPTLSYTVAHQGLRFTPVWVLLGIFCSIKYMQRAASRPPTVTAAVPATRVYPA
jgi:hypothetical protein